MAKLDLSESTSLPPNIKALLVPIGSALVLVLLSIFAIKTAYSKIMLQKSELSKMQKNERTLQQKQVYLQEVQATAINQAEPLKVAFPDKNPGLMAISQIRNHADELGIVFKSMNLGTEGRAKGGMLKVALSFDISGEFDKLLEYLNTLGELAPLLKLQNVNIDRSTLGLAEVTASVNVYFAPFPEKLPALTEPSPQLTSAEQEVLSKLLSLKRPPLAKLPKAITPGDATSPSERLNPFAIVD